MKNITIMFRKKLFFLCLFMLSLTGFSQTNFTVTLANVTATSTTIEFDVLLTVVAPAQGVRLASVAFGVNFDPAILNGGVPCSTANCGSYTYIAGSKSPALNALLPSTLTYRASPVGHLRATMTNLSGVNGIDILPGTYTVGRYRFTNTVAFACANANLWLQNVNTGGSTNTIVSWFPYGLATPLAAYTTINPVGGTGLTLTHTSASPYSLLVCGSPPCFTSGTYTQTPVTCFGGANGTATITMAPIPASLSATYVLDSGVSTPVTLSATGVFTITGLTAGAHTLSVTGSGTCTTPVSVPFTIGGPSGPLTNTTTITACDSYTWSVTGATYTTSGPQTGTTVNGSGCTVNETLNLTINNSTSNTTTVTACDTYTWAAPLGNGQTYTTSQTGITFVSTNGANCPHTETLNLTINPSPVTAPYSICQGGTVSGGLVSNLGGGSALPNYSGNNTGAPTFNRTQAMNQGETCLDSGVGTAVHYTTHSFVAPASGAYIFSMCGNATWDTVLSLYQSPFNPAGLCAGNTLVETGDDDCGGPLLQSVVTANLVQGVAYTLVVAGFDAAEFGAYTITSTSPAVAPGVDWFTTATLGSPIGTGSPFNPVGVAGSGIANTNTVGATTFYAQFPGSSCRTPAVFTVSPTTPTTTTITACDTYTWPVNGTTYTIGGTYTSVTGCTTETLILTITPSTTTGSVTTSICAGASYTWPANGVTYTTAQSGVTVVTGCNTATLNLTITPLTTNGSVTTSICAGASYTWPANGVTYTTAQTGVTVVTACNTATLNLTITPVTTTGSVTTSICAGASYTWPANGVTYTTAQTGVTVVTGCNTATLNLTITPLTTTGSVTTSICAGASYTWPANGVTYTTAQSGVTVVTGCNTATLNLTITPLTTNGSVTTSICAGSSYTWPLPNGTGLSYTTAQTNLTNVVGCNTATLNLTITPLTTNGSVTTSICAGSSYTWPLPNGTGLSYTTAQTNLTNVAGCNTATLNLTITPLTTNGSVTTSICAGSSYTWPANGVTYTTAQSGVTVVTACNTATLNLTITPVTTTGSVTTSICAGSSYIWPANGVTYTTAQTGVTVVTACNTATLNLTITPLTTTGSVTTSICAGASYTWPANGVTYTTAQTGVTVVTGCNTATLNLTITPLTTTGSVTTSICAGSSYTWPANGVTYTTAQTGVTVVTACNTATLNLTITPLTTTGSVTTSICAGSSYTWPANGVTYTTAQTGVTVVTACNTATLNLTITPLTTTGSVTTSICAGASYTWPANGVTYTTAQTGVTVVTACNTATLNLTITPLTTTGSVTTSICAGASYTWPANGVTYTTAQTGVTVVTACNTATLNLTINTAPTPTGSASQSFSVVNLNNATIANLVVSPAGVIWYASLANAQTGTNPLPSTTVITNGSTYWAVNVVGGCRSTPFAVLVSVTLGNEEFDNLNFSFYPNPTSSILNIVYTKVISDIQVFNLLGQEVMKKKTNETEVQIDLSPLAEATYFVKVTSEGRDKIIKVIKRN